MFGLGYIFAHQIQSGIREVQQWFTVALAAGLALWLALPLLQGAAACRSAGRAAGPLRRRASAAHRTTSKAYPDEPRREVDSLLERQALSGASIGTLARPAVAGLPSRGLGTHRVAAHRRPPHPRRSPARRPPLAPRGIAPRPPQHAGTQPAPATPDSGPSLVDVPSTGRRLESRAADRRNRVDRPAGS